MTRLAWGGVLLWVAVVLCGSGIAWLAIDEAGRGVISKDPAASATFDSIPSRPGSSPATSRPPEPTRTPTTRTSPSSGPTSTPARSDGSGTPRTWSGTAGSVTVVCSGSTAVLRSATPAFGWRAEREDDGPGVRVKFERDDADVRVGATCSGGVPQFRVVDDE